MRTQMQVVSPKALVKVKESHKAVGRLITLFDVHYITINRWIDSNDVRLTNPQALEIISEESGIPVSSLLVDQ